MPPRAAGIRDYSFSGVCGFLPNFASYSATNLASSFGLQRKHCDSGRLCSLHQSPFCWYSAASFALHWAHISSGTPCSLHHHPLWSSVVAAGVAGCAPSGPVVAVFPQPAARNPASVSKENEVTRAQDINSIESSIRPVPVVKLRRNRLGHAPRFRVGLFSRLFFSVF